MAEMLWKPVVLLGDGRDMNCKAVVFDMDGVILDSEQLVVKSWQKTADKYGIEDIESFCMAALGLNREAAKKDRIHWMRRDMRASRVRWRRNSTGQRQRESLC